MIRIGLNILIFLLCLSYPKISQSQWLDPSTLHATAILEKIQNSSFVTHGTGFLMYNYDKPNEFIVVTCAHMIKDKNQIAVRVKPDSTFLKFLEQIEQKNFLFGNAFILGNTVRFIANLGNKDCYIHPELDIAAFRLQITSAVIKTDTGKKSIDLANVMGIPRSGIQFHRDLSLGDEVYFIGFPLGYGANDYVEPVIRSGSIAWMPTDEDFFLLDAFSFGGNSGSPIFRKRIIGSKPGKLSWSGAKLVGMIVGHQSIKLKNILNQPDSTELKFEVTDIDMNIGLARCIYIDDIMFTINKLMEITK